MNSKSKVGPFNPGDYDELDAPPILHLKIKPESSDAKKATKHAMIDISADEVDHANLDRKQPRLPLGQELEAGIRGTPIDNKFTVFLCYNRKNVSQYTGRIVENMVMSFESFDNVVCCTGWEKQGFVDTVIQSHVSHIEDKCICVILLTENAFNAIAVQDAILDCLRQKITMVFIQDVATCPILSSLFDGVSKCFLDDLAKYHFVLECHRIYEIQCSEGSKSGSERITECDNAQVRKAVYEILLDGCVASRFRQFDWTDDLRNSMRDVTHKQPNDMILTTRKSATCDPFARGVAIYRRKDKSSDVVAYLPADSAYRFVNVDADWAKLSPTEYFRLVEMNSSSEKYGDLTSILGKFDHFDPLREGWCSIFDDAGIVQLSEELENETSGTGADSMLPIEVDVTLMPINESSVTAHGCVKLTENDMFIQVDNLSHGEFACQSDLATDMQRHTDSTTEQPANTYTWTFSYTNESKRPVEEMTALVDNDHGVAMQHKNGEDKYVSKHRMEVYFNDPLSLQSLILCGGKGKQLLALPTEHNHIVQESGTVTPCIVDAEATEGVPNDRINVGTPYLMTPMGSSKLLATSTFGYEAGSTHDGRRDNQMDTQQAGSKTANGSEEVNSALDKSASADKSDNTPSRYEDPSWIDDTMSSMVSSEFPSTFLRSGEMSFTPVMPYGPSGIMKESRDEMDKGSVRSTSMPIIVEREHSMDGAKHPYDRNARPPALVYEEKEVDCWPEVVSISLQGDSDCTDGCAAETFTVDTGLKCSLLASSIRLKSISGRLIKSMEISVLKWGYACDTDPSSSNYHYHHRLPLSSTLSIAFVASNGITGTPTEGQESTNVPQGSDMKTADKSSEIASFFSKLYMDACYNAAVESVKKRRLCDMLSIKARETLQVALDKVKSLSKKRDYCSLRNTVRLYVSSGLSDMRYERQYLHDHVWSRLRTVCESWGLHLLVIDPHWGDYGHGWDAESRGDEYVMTSMDELIQCMVCTCMYRCLHMCVYHIFTYKCV
jgi:hypothetical protein